MKKEITQMFLAGKLCLLVVWPVTAAAAQVTFGEELAGVQMLSILMTLLLSAVMGSASLLHAMKLEYEKNGKINQMWLFVSSKLLGSLVAGLLMFFTADSLGIPNSYKAGAIMLAAFGGTWFIERMYKQFADKTAPEIK